MTEGETSEGQVPSRFGYFRELLKATSLEVRQERSLKKVLGGLGQTAFDEVAEDVVSRDYAVNPKVAEALARRLGFEGEVGFGRTSFSLGRMEQQAQALRQRKAPGAREQAEALEALLAIFRLNRDLPNNDGLTREKLEEMGAKARERG
jgi:hypothetical protein